jgi:hypothetical protein
MSRSLEDAPAAMILLMRKFSLSSKNSSLGRSGTGRDSAYFEMRIDALLWHKPGGGDYRNLL